MLCNEQVTAIFAKPIVAVFAYLLNCKGCVQVLAHNEIQAYIKREGNGKLHFGGNE
jgi:hypothetical protein